MSEKERKKPYSFTLNEANSREKETRYGWKVHFSYVLTHITLIDSSELGSSQECLKAEERQVWCCFSCDERSVKADQKARLTSFKMTNLWFYAT